jgi:hypothetical protein
VRCGLQLESGGNTAALHMASRRGRGRWQALSSIAGTRRRRELRTRPG